VQWRDLAFGEGEQADAGEGEVLVEGGDILLIACQRIL
jgi:hypothetical protein